MPNPCLLHLWKCMLVIPVNQDITLKLPHIEDATALYQLIDRNRDFFRRYLTWIDQTKSVKDSEAFILKSRKDYEIGKTVSLCVFYKNTLVGTIALHYLDAAHRKMEIGYWLSEEHQRKGIIRSACKALIEYAFKNLKLHRLEIRCCSHNQRSKRVPESLGFVREGILRDASLLNGKYHDMVLYSLLST